MLINAITYIQNALSQAKKIKISGTIDYPGQTVRSIILFRRSTREVVAETVVKGTGSWELYTEEEPSDDLFIICIDESKEYEAQIYDTVSLCPVVVETPADPHNLYPVKVDIINDAVTLEYMKHWKSTLQELKGDIHTLRYDAGTKAGVFVDSSGDVNTTSRPELDTDVVINNSKARKTHVFVGDCIERDTDPFNDNSCIFCLDGDADGFINKVNGEVGLQGSASLPVFSPIHTFVCAGAQGVQQNEPTWYVESSDTQISLFVSLSNVYSNVQPVYIESGVHSFWLYTSGTFYLSIHKNGAAIHTLNLGTSNDPILNFFINISNTQVEVYRNATKVVTQSVSLDLNSLFQVRTYVYNGVTARMNIRDLKIFNRAVTQAEVTSLNSAYTAAGELNPSTKNKAIQSIRGLDFKTPQASMYYPFNGHIGDLTGNTWLYICGVALKLDSVVFNGTTGILHEGSTPDVTNGNGVGDESLYSVEVVFKAERINHTAEQCIFKSGNASGGFALCLTRDNRVVFYGRVPGTTTSIRTAPNAVQANTWYKVVASRTELRVLTLENTPVVVAAGNIAYVNGSGQLTVGGDSGGSPIDGGSVKGKYFLGEVREIALYNLNGGALSHSYKFGTFQDKFAGLNIQYLQFTAGFCGEQNGALYMPGALTHCGLFSENTRDFLLSDDFFFTTALRMENTSSCGIFGTYYTREFEIGEYSGLYVSWGSPVSGGYLQTDKPVLSTFNSINKWITWEVYRSTSKRQIDGITWITSVNTAGINGIHSLPVNSVSATGSVPLTPSTYPVRLGHNGYLPATYFKGALSNFQLFTKDAYLQKEQKTKQTILSLQNPIYRNNYNSIFFDEVGFPALKGRATNNIKVDHLTGPGTVLYVVLTKDNKTYFAYTNSNWNAVISKDPVVHGQAGNDSWHYKNAGNWYISTDRNAALSKAMEDPLNRMPAASLGAVSSTALNQFIDVSTGILNFGFCAKVMYGSLPVVRNILYDDKYIWKSSLYKLYEYTGPKDGSFVFIEDEIQKIQDYSIFKMMTNDTVWESCQHNQPIPNITPTTDFTDKEIQFKLEIENNKMNVDRLCNFSVYMKQA